MVTSGYQSTHPAHSDLVTEVLRKAGSAKHVGRLTGRSHRTVQKWQSGEAEPPASVLLTLMAKSKEVAQTILAATGITKTTEWMDAEEARIQAELISLRAMRRGDAKTAAPGGAAGGWNGVERRAENLATKALSVSRGLK